MNLDNRKLIAMYVGLTFGSAFLLAIGSVVGVVDVRLSRSLLVAFVGVTTILYLIMVVTYKTASKHVP